MTASRPFLLRLWHGFWGFLDGTRRVVVNIVFVLLVVFIIRLVLDSGQTLVLQQDTALFLAPEGRIVEQYSGSPVDRALAEATESRRQETRLRDLLEAIRLAADDGRITHLVIHPDGVSDLGLASAQELERAVMAFKQSGKPVIAYGELLGQHQYYLAALADEVWLNPDGLIWIDGYARFRNYYQNALEKLAVQVNLFRVGEYKSAMEPYTRQDMSPAAREANLYWMNGLWEQFLATISRHRGLPAELLQDHINAFPRSLEQAGGHAARVALDYGLVDRLLSRPEARGELVRRVGAADEQGDFRQIDLWNYLAVRGNEAAAPQRQVAVVVAEGEIFGGDQPPGMVGGESTARLIRQAVRDENTDAIVMRVDSPGGDAFASEVIRRELMAARDAGKPVVVSMGDVAASGGYWIAMGADEVWANAATITGSIGIFGIIPTFAESLQKIGINNDGVGTTALAGGLRLERPLSEPVRRVVQSIIENGYDEFLAVVAEGRDLSLEAVAEVAEGRVWGGQQALDLGLVDQLGGLDQAIAAAARRAGIGDDHGFYYVGPELSTFERFLVDLTAAGVRELDVNLNFELAGLGPLTGSIIGDVRRLLDQRQGFSAIAHCLCTLQ